MSDSPEFPRWPALPASATASPLNYDGSYPCPVCRHGQITTLALMDVFGCSYCRHVFTANLQDQVLQMADSPQPLLWSWTGQTWRSRPPQDQSLSVLLWMLGAIAVILPTSLVSLAYYIFPPLPDAPLSWVPLVWIGLTFGVHSVMVGWLAVEYYQPPLYVFLRYGLTRFWQR